MQPISPWPVLALLGLLTLPACIEIAPEGAEDFEPGTAEASLIDERLALAGCKHCAPPDAGTGTDAGSGSTDAGTVADGGVSSGCLAGPLLTSLGKSDVLVGGKMTDAVAAQAPFDIRYMYLAGGLFDTVEPCTSCLNCRAGALSCSNASGGCRWWGCWQWDQQAPGQYLRDFLQTTASRGQLPMITYYQLLHTSGVADGTAVVLAAQNLGLMQRYFNDWRFVLKQIGSRPALLHIEPDFWAYAQFLTLDPRLQPAAVASANPTDCATQPNSVAGMGHCMIAMARKYAPNAKVGLHASAWATKLDVHLNINPLLNVSVEAGKVADFLRLCGAANADFVVVEASDRDAQWYQLKTGTNHWWDTTNTTLPHFRQAFTWSKALSERLGKPNLWWQLPVGNMALPGTNEKWRDNRLDYFFDRPGEVAASHGFGMVFGSGADGQTTPSTDNGRFLQRAQGYFASGGQTACR
ncbi:MAG TPA: hypothetical protein VF794_16100 [Archangium sp.]|jgi:hypothetical protein|uniref:hypothetical protein n=1 Tax=Archangium sp. TaxID=1872627 RepID=UPI002ED9FDDC